jgi:hypothetical protein
MALKTGRFGLEDGIFDAGRAVEPEILGVFAENLVVEGIDAADEGIGFVFCEGYWVTASSRMTLRW